MLRLPSPTIDFNVADGVAEIPIEERGADEVTNMTGKTSDGRIESVRIVPDGSPVANYGFDVTPARLITGSDHRTRRDRRLARGLAGAFLNAPDAKRLPRHFPDRVTT